MVRRGASSGSLQVCRRDIATVRPASQCFNVIGVDVFTYDYDSSTAPALTNPSSTMMMTTIACDMDLLGLTSVRTIILRQCRQYKRFGTSQKCWDLCEIDEE